MATKRKITGTVISNKNDKTIAVEVSGYRKHPKYKKRVQFRHRYYAHDEANVAQVGDVVTIEESRPLSALKRFVLVSVDKKALETVEVSDGEEVAEVLHEEKEEE
jgi:small subunit ribosomal protein S17